MPESCRRISPDEITLYQAHAARHEIKQVLAVGYEGEPWVVGNNDYLATLAAQHAWVRPTAFVADPSQLTVQQLSEWQAQWFVGISLYLFTAEETATLGQVTAEVWRWLTDHAWLISVNSTGEHWTSWQPVLASYPELRLLIAHLGIPPAATNASSLDEAHAALASVLDLAPFPRVTVKFSGFYALSIPGHAYPHSASWPYAQAISDTFGNSRIVWASDFSPALEYVSFPQTVDVIAAMPWLTEDDRKAIYHDNLAHLLAAVDERNPKR
jgi:L-fuconolactonase